MNNNDERDYAEEGHNQALMEFDAVEGFEAKDEHQDGSNHVHLPPKAQTEESRKLLKYTVTFEREVPDYDSYANVADLEAADADVELPIDTPEKAAKMEKYFIEEGYAEIVAVMDEGETEVTIEVVDDPTDIWKPHGHKKVASKLSTSNLEEELPWSWDK